MVHVQRPSPRPCGQSGGSTTPQRIAEPADRDPLLQLAAVHAIEADAGLAPRPVVRAGRDSEAGGAVGVVAGVAGAFVAGAGAVVHSVYERPAAGPTRRETEHDPVSLLHDLDVAEPPGAREMATERLSGVHREDLERVARHGARSTSKRSRES